ALGDRMAHARAVAGAIPRPDRDGGSGALDCADLFVDARPAAAGSDRAGGGCCLLVLRRRARGPRCARSRWCTGCVRCPLAGAMVGGAASVSPRAHFTPEGFIEATIRLWKTEEVAGT